MPARMCGQWVNYYIITFLLELMMRNYITHNK